MKDTSLMKTVYLPLSFVAVICICSVLVLIRRFNIYAKYPACLFRWVLYSDLGYALWSGVFRWFPYFPWHEQVSYPGSQLGCSLATAFDTFFQSSTIFINTCIVFSVFVMVHVGPSTIPQKYLTITIIGYWIFCLLMMLPTAFQETHVALGWCTTNSE